MDLVERIETSDRPESLMQFTCYVNLMLNNDLSYIFNNSLSKEHGICAFMA